MYFNAENSLSTETWLTGNAVTMRQACKKPLTMLVRVLLILPVCLHKVVLPFCLSKIVLPISSSKIMLPIKI